MELLTAASFDTANLMTNVGLATVAGLTVAIGIFGGKKIIGFWTR